MGSYLGQMTDLQNVQRIRKQKIQAAENAISEQRRARLPDAPVVKNKGSLGQKCPGCS